MTSTKATKQRMPLSFSLNNNKTKSAQKDFQMLVEYLIHHFLRLLR